MKKAESDCYKLIQEIAIKQHPKCKWPGCNKPSTVGHHLFKRDRMATAFLPEAVWGLCVMHHDEAHREPAVFKRYVYQCIDDRYYELLRLSWITMKPDFKETKKYLQMFLTRLQK